MMNFYVLNVKYRIKICIFLINKKLVTYFLLFPSCLLHRTHPLLIPQKHGYLTKKYMINLCERNNCKCTFCSFDKDAALDLKPV